MTILYEEFYATKKLNLVQYQQIKLNLHKSYRGSL